MQHEQILGASPLGSDSPYVNQYDPGLLFPVQRDANWQQRGVVRHTLPFQGVDIWNGYEISWLNAKGKPLVRTAVFTIAADSRNIIESKSFKLYLNSYNLSRFDNEEQVRLQMEQDLSAVAQGQVSVQLYPLAQTARIGVLPGECIDELDISIDRYQPDAGLLVCGAGVVSEQLVSHLLKSNCPVTGQPDWASIQISYTGPRLEKAALLRYLISYREHGDFHEQCVETIFMDIWQRCRPQTLTVYARYVRRGGLDINPYRSSVAGLPENLRLTRQ